MIVGLCGYSKVGKDALADMMQEYNRAAFADALKSEVEHMLAMVGIEVDLWGEDKEQWRDMLVFWGRKRREIDPDYWIKQLYMRHVGIVRDRIVITDVRYPNEVAWIFKHGGRVLRLTRPGYGPANDEERSTIAAIDARWDVPTLVNNGTLRELEVLARKTLNQLMENAILNKPLK